MKNYIPKFKLDVEAIKNLNSLEFATIKADVSELLEWMQDLHWGNGSGIAEYLAPHVNEIKEELLYILNINDDIWKYNIIKALIAHSVDRPAPELMTVIQRIAEYPTRGEKEEDVDEAAKEVIAHYLA